MNNSTINNTSTTLPPGLSLHSPNKFKRISYFISGQNQQQQRQQQQAQPQQQPQQQDAGQGMFSYSAT